MNKRSIVALQKGGAMRTGEVADMFGVTTETIRNWVKRPELRDLFSPSALGSKRKQAEFTEEDVQLINSIFFVTNEGNHNWKDIAAKLATGWRHPQLPERAAFTAAQTAPGVMLAARALASESRLGDALKEIDVYKAAILELNTRINELESEKSTIVERLMNERQVEIERINKQKEALLRELGDVRVAYESKIGELKSEIRLLQGKGE